MEKNKEISFQIEYLNSPNVRTKQIIQKYWVYQTNKFPNKPKRIILEYNLTYRKLRDINTKFSVVTAIRNCLECNKIIEYTVSSHYDFSSSVYWNSICKSCRDEQHKERRKIEAKKVQLKEESRRKKLEAGIENRAWEEFTDKELRLILKIIDNPDTSTIGFKKSLYNYKEGWTLLYKANEQCLLDVDLNTTGNEVLYFHFSKNLKPILEKLLYPKINSEEHHSVNWSRLSFKLKKNKNKFNKDSPTFGGTVEFKRDLFIKAGTECLYGVWPRSDDNMWIAITPLQEVIASKNTSLDNLPVHVRDVLKKLLNQ